MRIREVAGRRRAALAARNGSLTCRRCPITATSKLRVARGRAMDAGSGADWYTTRTFASKSRRHAPPRKLLQRDQAIGACERVQSRRRIAIDVVVDVGAAQGDDQRPIRDNARENPGCCRRCARRAAQSSDPPPLHRSGGRLERRGRARAGSASSGRWWSHSRTVTTSGPV